jgi:creatinine amidohydrolase
VSVVHRWDQLTREEISSHFPSALFVLPVGSTEQHGRHLATGTDTTLVHSVAERAAERAVRPDTIILAPTLPYGASDHHLPFGGTLSLGATTFLTVLHDLLCSVAQCGCKRAFVLNGHGGNATACSLAVAEASREHRLVAATALFSQLIEDGSLDVPVTGHAGVFETSLILALDPERVRPEHAAPSPGGPARSRRRGLVVSEPGRWQELDGWTDHPDAATPELGEAALELAVVAVAAAFEEVADLPV